MRYDPAGTKCSGHAQQGVKHLRSWCMERWHLVHDLGIYNCRPVRGGSSLSLHGEGRAWDAGLSAFIGAQKAQGDELFRWAIANAGPLGVQEVIWDRRIWTSRSENVGPYSGASAHRDHVHIGLTWLGARFLTRSDLDKTLGPQEDPLVTAFKDDGEVYAVLTLLAYQTYLGRKPTMPEIALQSDGMKKNGVLATVNAIASSPEAKK